MHRVLLLLVSFMLVTPARASAADVAAVLEAQRQHGFGSPAIAIDALTEAGQDIEHAPLDLRMRYHNALAFLYTVAEQSDPFQAQVTQLERMAREEQCVPCGQYKLVRESQFAIRKQDIPSARAMLPQLEALKAADPALKQAIVYALAATYGATGSQARSLEEGIKSSELASSTNNPAEQVRSLNLIMLANIARRDLVNAEKQATEAYALAERIGFVYMMAYIRNNQSWLYGLKGEPDKQLDALREALDITRTNKGMADTELTILVNLAEYYLGRKDYKQAVTLSRQALRLADIQHKATAKGVVSMTLAVALVELGEREQGITTMQQAHALLKQSGADSYVLDATEGLAQVYESSGKYREALAALREAIALREKATLREREKAIAEAQAKFSAERKDNEILRLSLENGRRQAEVAARAWQQRLWATAALALAMGAALLMLLVKRARARNRLLEDSNAVLSDQSVHDPLTGAFNRRHCVNLMGQQEALLATKSRDRTYSACTGLMLLDVDHFKHINDTYGHSAGDLVLVEMARRMQELVRQHDVVVRWGGEEFVLVLPGTAPEGMLVLAERVLNIIAAAPVAAEGRTIPVTVSLGCVSYPQFPGQPWQDALKVADAAMYMAKQQGRNRAVCLMGVIEGAPRDLLLSDLAAAAAAGQVLLRTVPGPVAADAVSA
ncbi:tetratricopeptide repeat-containing diguanylate cyclase [Massilia sp. CF038]|uniref:tetratricopeptide repeat-containing diguanylate cyclase n=1 Tax=Massilia sp. CF038 TaxID=1881045 RepID=UPI00091785A5|nr:tetratricopeptide repeat-containing diguanylate cyclase [Massilia sp. CF038]SHG65457.1 diguanylate cyclase (GGDEF) domain-containing protein [Massilia sp. CF038]